MGRARRFADPRRSRRLILKDENSAGEPNDANWNYELAFYYLRSKQLDFVLWGRWKLDAEDEVVYQADRAMQFRFDSARGRWLAAKLDPPAELAAESYPSSGWTLAGDMLFTDYLGDLPYNDGVLDQSTYAHSDATRYLGLAAEKDIASGAETYYHGDLIDSTMLATDADADAGVRMAYTAFGEVLTAGDPNEGGGAPGGSPEGAPRYLYAGGWGYESGGFTSDASPEQTWALSLQGADTSLPPITLQHVGHRWYQPDSGRFVQRDPIGIHDEWNVYTYVDNGPDSSIDVDGQTRVFVQAKRGIPHAAVIMQSGNKWVRVDFGPYRGRDNVRTTWGQNIGCLMRPGDLIKKWRKTTRKEDERDLKWFLKSKKYMPYNLFRNNCIHVSERLFEMELTY